MDTARIPAAIYDLSPDPRLKNVLWSTFYLSVQAQYRQYSFGDCQSLMLSLASYLLTSSLSKMSPTVALGQLKLGAPDPICISHEGSKYWSHFLMFPRVCISRKLELEVEPETSHSYVAWEYPKEHVKHPCQTPIPLAPFLLTVKCSQHLSVRYTQGSLWITGSGI